MLERHRFSVGFRIWRGLGAAALLGAGVGCASGPGVRPFEAVDSVTVDAAGPVGEVLQAPLGSAIGKAARSSAGEAAAAGAVAGFECGPFFVICSPVAALVGAGLGAVVGGAEEAASTLPDGQPETLNAVSNDVLSVFEPREALRDAAEEAARAHGMTVMPRGAEATLSLELQRLDWIIGTGNTVRPRAVVLATMRWPDGVLSRQYQRDGARLAVRDWTADRGAPIPMNIEALFADIAAEIAEDFDGAR